MLRSLILLLGLLLAVGCTSIRCPVPADEPLLTLVHASAGDGPTAWELIVFEDGVLQLTKLGRKGRCRRASEDGFSELQAALASWDPSASKPESVHLSHHELIQIEGRGARQIFRVEEVPQSLQPLLRSLDEVFAEAYGPYYDWLLLGRKSGPRL